MLLQLTWLPDAADRTSGLKGAAEDGRGLGLSHAIRDCGGARGPKTCGMISCSRGTTATVALSGGSPREHKVLRGSTAPIGPTGIAAHP